MKLKYYLECGVEDVMSHLKHLSFKEIELNHLSVSDSMKFQYETILYVDGGKSKPLKDRYGLFSR